MGIEPTTSGLDLPLLRPLSFKVAQRKSGTILDGKSRRRESYREEKQTTELFLIPYPCLLCSSFLYVTQIMATETTMTSAKAATNANIGITKVIKEQQVKGSASRLNGLKNLA